MKKLSLHPKTWLQESILLALILPPFGLAALFYSAKVAPLSITGEYEASRFYSRKAKSYIKLGFFFIISVVTLLILTSLFWFFMSRALIR